jgi:hypothetical protein
MIIRASELAAAVAERVNPALPEGFSVVAAHGVLRIRSSSSWTWAETDLRGITAGSENDVDLPDAAVPREYLFDRVAAAVEQFLSNLQDYISEELTVPWPEDRATSRRAMAMPFVAFDGHKLRSGFGHPQQPSVEFPLIELPPLVR